MNLIKKSYLRVWTKLFSFLLVMCFLYNCALSPREVMREGIKTTNQIKNMSKISKESIKEEVINNTKKAIESIGR